MAGGQSDTLRNPREPALLQVASLKQYPPSLAPKQATVKSQFQGQALLGYERAGHSLRNADVGGNINSFV